MTREAAPAGKPLTRRGLGRAALGGLGVLAGLGGEPAGAAVAEPKVVRTWGRKGDGPGEFYSPIGIAIDRHDRVFVTDLNNARVQQFTSDGEHVGGFDLPLDAPLRKSCIVGGIAVDADGLLYLAFLNQDFIGVYTPKGELVRKWGKRGAGEGELRMPGGLVLGPGGTVFVPDQCNHRVQKFTTKGQFLAAWGRHGFLPGRFGGPEPAGSRFGGPHFLALDSCGRLYTTEGCFGRVQQLTQEGRPLGAWGSKGDEPGGFGSYGTGFSGITFGPIAVQVDRFDRVWVSSLNSRVQAFTPEGKFLLGLGGLGQEPGRFARPHSLAFDSKGFLYVADAGNERIQKFEVPPRDPGRF